QCGAVSKKSLAIFSHGPSGADSLPRAPSLDGARQTLQQPHRGRPVHAPVGDALAVDERLTGNEVLSSADEVTLDHHAADAPVAGFDLLRDAFDDRGLILRSLAAV